MKNRLILVVLLVLSLFTFGFTDGPNSSGKVNSEKETFEIAKAPSSSAVKEYCYVFVTTCDVIGSFCSPVNLTDEQKLTVWDWLENTHCP